ncbi:MAG TPA: hypothetical protein VII23_02380 [Terriglobales bacterium]
MDRNRLVLRLGIIAVAVVIFFARGGQHSPQMVKGFSFALVFVLIAMGIRMTWEASKRKKLEQEKQLAFDGKDVELFTKPKDF